ncbi:MAG: hypothetical protein GF383_03715 [Candidatus Lokiarchaeota archaeon]|nr:hypothetical protein [Candidatus Lokiarchaeota archaeon]MBD3338802.1 hypothetical protein [Candidatus Lokiarchaeota archaeon]
MTKKKIADEIPELQKDFDEVLLLAARNKDFRMVKWAVNMGADVNARNEDGKSALIYACDYKASIEIAQYLVKNGAEVNVKAKYGDSPLGYGAMYGELALVKFLLESKADVNMQGEYGRTALHYASTPRDWSSNYFGIAKLLLENGADPNLVNDGGDNPLLEALMYDNFDVRILNLLVEFGIVLEATGGYDATALSRAAERGNLEIMKKIEEKVKHSKSWNEILRKALIGAMNEDKKEIVIYLLKKAENKLEKDFYCINVLAYASRFGYTDIVEYLIDGILDPKTDDVYYGLKEACYEGHLGVVKLLIQAGADPNGGDFGASENPLMKVARHGYIDIANYLLEQGADIEVRSYEGHTPLLFAAYDGKNEMVQFLINRGANVNATNNLNWNAVMQACVQGYYDLVKVLIEAGSELHLIDEEKGATTLMLAAWSCSLKIVKLLLENGVDKTIKDKSGATASDLARSRGCSQIAEFIDKY